MYNLYHDQHQETQLKEWLKHMAFAVYTNFKWEWFDVWRNILIVKLKEIDTSSVLIEYQWWQLNFSSTPICWMLIYSKDWKLLVNWTEQVLNTNVNYFDIKPLFNATLLD